jgi:hypothetical protein
MASLFRQKALLGDGKRVCLKKVFKNTLSKIWAKVKFEK